MSNFFALIGSALTLNIGFEIFFSPLESKLRSISIKEKMKNEYVQLDSFSRFYDSQFARNEHQDTIVKDFKDLDFKVKLTIELLRKVESARSYATWFSVSLFALLSILFFLDKFGYCLMFASEVVFGILIVLITAMVIIFSKTISNKSKKLFRENSYRIKDFEEIYAKFSKLKFDNIKVVEKSVDKIKKNQ